MLHNPLPQLMLTLASTFQEELKFKEMQKCWGRVNYLGYAILKVSDKINTKIVTLFVLCWCLVLVATVYTF